MKVFLNAPCCRVTHRLAIVLCVAGKPEATLYVLAVVCSSWSAVNLATSKRDVLTPYGDENVTSVRTGNRMVARLDHIDVGPHLLVN